MEGFMTSEAERLGKKYPTRGSPLEPHAFVRGSFCSISACLWVISGNRSVVGVLVPNRFSSFKCPCKICCSWLKSISHNDGFSSRCHSSISRNAVLNFCKDRRVALQNANIVCLLVDFPSLYLFSVYLIAAKSASSKEIKSNIMS